MFLWEIEPKEYPTIWEIRKDDTPIYVTNSAIWRDLIIKMLRIYPNDDSFLILKYQNSGADIDVENIALNASLPKGNSSWKSKSRS